MAAPVNAQSAVPLPERRSSGSSHSTPSSGITALATATAAAGTQLSNTATAIARALQNFDKKIKLEYRGDLRRDFVIKHGETTPVDALLKIINESLKPFSFSPEIRTEPSEQGNSRILRLISVGMD